MALPVRRPLVIAIVLLLAINLSQQVPLLSNRHKQSSQDNSTIRRTSSDKSTLIVVDNHHPPASKRNEPRATYSPRDGARKGKKAAIDLSHMFREEVEGYPEEEIRLILKKTPEELKSLFNVLNTPLDPHNNLTERVAHYYGDEDEHALREESICRTVTRNIYPREATKQNSLVYVANNQDFMQVIQAELCQSPDQDCNYLADSLPYGMTSVCNQKYAYKKLLYLDPLDKRMATDLFRYPSCCSCYIRYSPVDLRSSAVGAKMSNGTTSSPVSSSFAQSPSALDADQLVSRTPEVPTISVADQQQHQANRSHERSPVNQTLVLQEDKVYAPIKRR